MRKNGGYGFDQLMSKYLVFAFAVVALGAGCSAPQGKKLASNQVPAPIATGPASKSATVIWKNKGEVISLQRGGTVTALLQANQNDGYAWKFSEIPDPTVLKLLSKEYIAPTKPNEVGQEKWVFQSTGPGDVEVKLFYGNLRPSEVFYTVTYNFIASVNDEPVKSSKRH